MANVTNLLDFLLFLSYLLQLASCFTPYTLQSVR